MNHIRWTRQRISYCLYSVDHIITFKFLPRYLINKKIKIVFEVKQTFQIVCYVLLFNLMGVISENCVGIIYYCAVLFTQPFLTQTKKCFYFFFARLLNYNTIKIMFIAFLSYVKVNETTQSRPFTLFLLIMRNSFLMQLQK